MNVRVAVLLLHGRADFGLSAPPAWSKLDISAGKGLTRAARAPKLVHIRFRLRRTMSHCAAQPSPTQRCCETMSPIDLNPVTLLWSITQRFPWLKFVWGAVAIAAAIAIARLFGVDARFTFIGSFAGIFLLYNFFIFSRATALQVNQTSAVATAQVYIAFVLGNLFIVAIMASTLFAYPLDLRRWITGDGPDIILRNDFSDRYIEGQPARFGKDALFNNQIDTDRLESQIKIAMDKWKEWVYEAIKPANEREQVLVWESSPFTQHYNDIKARMTVDDPARFVEGVAFLVKDGEASSSGYRPVYKQVQLGIEPGSETKSNHLYLPKPDIGEVLFIIIRMKSKGDALLPSNPDDFNFRVKPL
jgi:hypothetical protein